MRVLFDQNIPRNLRQFMKRHEVRTAANMGWGRVENGELLAKAEEAGFDVFLTGDQSLSYQQNLHARRIGIVELTKNNWPSVKPRIAEIVRAVETCGAGEYRRVVCESVCKPRRRRLDP
jgi:hypothetical protein